LAFCDINIELHVSIYDAESGNSFLACSKVRIASSKSYSSRNESALEISRAIEIFGIEGVVGVDGIVGLADGSTNRDTESISKMSGTGIQDLTPSFVPATIVTQAKQRKSNKKYFLNISIQNTKLKSVLIFTKNLQMLLYN